MIPEKEIPLNHPVREVFCSLTKRGAQQTQLFDTEIHYYLTNLLVDFIHIEHVFRFQDESGRHLQYAVDMLEKIEQSSILNKRDLTNMLGTSRSSGWDCFQKASTAVGDTSA